MEVLHIKTPTLHSLTLSKQLGKEVYLKMENYQPSGSFKLRGIGQLCQEEIAKGAKHLVSSSGGNAGFAVAYAGNMLGVPTTVFVPETTHQIYRDHIVLAGANLSVAGSVWDEAEQAAIAYANSVAGASYIPPFDHQSIWDGHASMITEVSTQCPKPDAIVVAVGGGGLLSGVLTGCHQQGWQDLPMIAVETEGAASLAATMQAKKLVSLDKITSIATTLGAKRISQELFAWTKKHKIIPVSVSDKSTVDACLHFVDDHRALVEPACGAALSLAYDKHPMLSAYQNILFIVCGGVGVSLPMLYENQQRLRS